MRFCTRRAEDVAHCVIGVGIRAIVGFVSQLSQIVITIRHLNGILARGGDGSKYSSGRRRRSSALNRERRTRVSKTYFSSNVRCINIMP